MWLKVHGTLRMGQQKYLTILLLQKIYMKEKSFSRLKYKSMKHVGLSIKIFSSTKFVGKDMGFPVILLKAKRSTK